MHNHDVLTQLVPNGRTALPLAPIPLPACARAWRETKHWTIIDLIGTYGPQFPDWPANEQEYARIERGDQPIPPPLAHATCQFLATTLPTRQPTTETPSGWLGRAAGPSQTFHYDHAYGTWLHQRITRNQLSPKHVMTVLGGYHRTYLNSLYAGRGVTNWATLASTLHAAFPTAGFDQPPAPGIPCPPDLAEAIIACWTAKGWPVTQRVATALLTLAHTQPNLDPDGWFTAPTIGANSSLPVNHLTDGRWLHNPDAWPVLHQLSQHLPEDTYPGQAIADQVRAARNRFGYTQRGLAIALTTASGVKVTSAHIHALETNSPPPRTLQTILTALPTLTPTPDTSTVVVRGAGARIRAWVRQLALLTIPETPILTQDTPPPGDDASTQDWGSWFARWRARRGLALTTVTDAIGQHYHIHLPVRTLRVIEAGSAGISEHTPTVLARLAAAVTTAVHAHAAYRPEPAWTTRFNQALDQAGWPKQATITRLGLTDNPNDLSYGYTILAQLTTGQRPLTTTQQAHYLAALGITQPTRHH